MFYTFLHLLTQINTFNSLKSIQQRQKIEFSAIVPAEKKKMMKCGDRW